LLLIVEMLILAASTRSKERATRLATAWTTVNDFHEVPMGAASFVFPDSGFYPLTREAEGDKDNPVSLALLPGFTQGVDPADSGAKI